VTANLSTAPLLWLLLWGVNSKLCLFQVPIPIHINQEDREINMEKAVYQNEGR
jgi:hypothetical protein